MKNFIAVYIPGTVHTKRIPARDQRKIAESVAGEFAGKFGGCTTSPATGYWKSETGALIAERIIIVKSYYTPAPELDAQGFANAIAASLKTRLSQEAVTVETESGIEFV